MSESYRRRVNNNPCGAAHHHCCRGVDHPRLPRDAPLGSPEDAQPRRRRHRPRPLARRADVRLGSLDGPLDLGGVLLDLAAGMPDHDKLQAWQGGMPQGCRSARGASPAPQHPAPPLLQL